VLCWGANDDGQLGDGTHERRTAPAEVVDVHDAVDVVAAGGMTCVTRKHGEQRCFGKGTWAPPETTCTMNGDAGARCAGEGAAPAPALDAATAIAPYSTPSRGCAVLHDGTITCWGEGAWAGVHVPRGCVPAPVRDVRLDRATPVECDDAAAEPAAAEDAGADRGG
jgi:hypothetical protein